MANEADFTVRLIEKVKGPAARGEKAMGKFRDALGRFVKTTEPTNKALGKVREANGRFVRSTASAVKTGEKQLTLFGKLRTALSRYTKASKAAETANGRFRDATGRLRERNGRFVQGAGRGGAFGFGGGALDVLKGNLLTMGVEKVADIAAAVARAGFEFATFGQNARLAFTNLTKHGAPAERLFDHSRELAKRLGLDVMETTDQYKKFLALQFTPKSIDRMIKMGADLRALGTDAEGVQGVFTALGQIKGKGRVQGEELLQLAERGISTKLVWEEMAKLVGGDKSVDDIRKMQEQGKITAEVGLQAIENAINRKLQQNKLGDSGAKFADQTIDGLLGRFRAIFQSGGLSAFDKAAAPLTRVLGNTLDRLIAFVDSPAGAKLIEQMAASIERMAIAGAEMGGDFAKKFIEADWKAIGKEILDIAEGLVAAARAAAELAKMFGFGGPKTGADAPKKAVTEEHASVTGFAAAGATAGGALGSVVPGIGTLAGAAVGGLAGAGLAWLENLGVDAGIAIAKGMGSPSVGTQAYSAGIGIGEMASAGTRDALGIRSPSREAMKDGQHVARGLAIGMERGAKHVSAANLAMTDRIGPDMTSVAAPAMEGAGGARHSGPVSVTVNVHGASGDAEEIGRIAARESRRELEAFFRQLSMEA